MSSVVRTPPPTVNGMKQTSAVRLTTSKQNAAVFVACRDVEETQFVRARSVIGDGALDRISGVAQIDEVDALHNAPVLDVETGDDPRFQSHGAEPVRPFRPPAGVEQGEGRARIKPAIVERASHDCAGEAGAIGLDQPPDILDRGEAARGDHRNVELVGERDRAFHVEAGERAIARDVGVDDRRDAGVLEPARKVESRHVGRLRPAFDGDDSVAGVNADGDPAGIKTRRLAHEIRIAHRRGSNDHPGDAALKPAAHRLHVANSAAELQLDGDARENVANRLGVHGLAREGAVKIDDMQVVEPLRDKRLGLRRRIGVEDRRARHVAVDKANALAVFEIDRGK